MSSYLLNLTGQFIGSHSLMDQCCRIVSSLLKISRDDPAGQTTRVLGEQLQVRSYLYVFDLHAIFDPHGVALLQFLVSKLVACCVPCESNDKISTTASSQLVSLLHQLTISCDSSLHEYIKVFISLLQLLLSLLQLKKVCLTVDNHLWTCYSRS